MKKLLFLLLPLVVFSCKDYDAQFDELSRMISALEADNRQLESQLSAIQAQDALIAQATSARLTEFATAVSQALADIGAGVTQIGAGVAGSVQMLQGIIASLSQLATAIAERLGLEYDITPVDSSVFVTKAQRPQYSVLSTEKLASQFHYNVRPWQEGLDEVLSILITD